MPWLLQHGSPYTPGRRGQDALREFPGLEHRLEFVRELDGVSYFNDSKGTNVGAVMKSLESFSAPIILIAGGRDKAGDFTVLRHLIKERVKAAVLIGEAAEKMRRAFGDITETILAVDFRDAVSGATRRGKRRRCSAFRLRKFDMFLNFEDRETVQEGNGDGVMGKYDKWVRSRDNSSDRSEPHDL
jgi:UDP-N-acetylmuramoylalanine--D-glutamate ligase